MTHHSVDEIATQPIAESIKTARAQGLIYQALAEALSEAVPGLWAFLLEATLLGAQAIGSPACRQAAAKLAESPEPSVDQLRRRYRSLVHNPDSRPLALHESLYRRGRLAGSLTWDVECFYREAGMEPTLGELPDHASVELAFLGHLALAEADAREAGDSGLALRLRAERSRFLHVHAGVWLPGVGATMATCSETFYATVGQLLAGFLSEEKTGRRPVLRSQRRVPALRDAQACTLCGLCTGVCPHQALWIAENTTRTALMLDQRLCTGCNRCSSICPEAVLMLTPPGMPGGKPDGPRRVLKQSTRVACPGCGKPTVSQAELNAVVSLLQPDSRMAERLRLCIDCRSWIA